MKQHLFYNAVFSQEICASLTLAHYVYDVVISLCWSSLACDWCVLH